MGSAACTVECGTLAESAAGERDGTNLKQLEVGALCKHCIPCSGCKDRMGALNIAVILLSSPYPSRCKGLKNLLDVVEKVALSMLALSSALSLRVPMD